MRCNPLNLWGSERNWKCSSGSVGDIVSGGSVTCAVLLFVVIGVKAGSGRRWVLTTATRILPLRGEVSGPSVRLEIALVSWILHFSFFWPRF